MNSIGLPSMAKMYTLEEMAEKYPHDRHRYVRHRLTGKYFNPAKKTWHKDRGQAMQFSPEALRALQDGRQTVLSKYPLSDLEFVSD